MWNANTAGNQHGAVAVEFALVAVLFTTLLMAITGFGHWMYTLEMVADATRAAARTAVVCDLNNTRIKQVIESRVPQLSLADSDITVQYFPSGCSVSSCQGVTVSLSGVTFNSWMHFLPAALAVPAFTTSLPRESLSREIDGYTNPICN
jgi:Flp pilus assembly protein TadG